MLEALEQTLLRRGYTPRYAGRLVGELRAHVEDGAATWIEQGCDQANARRLALEALGDPDALLKAVESSAVARSNWRRHPVLCFLLSPFLIYTSALVLVLLGSILVGDLLSADCWLWTLGQRSGPWLPLVWGGSLVAFLWGVGQRHRCAWFWPAAATLLLAWLTSIARFGLRPEGGGELAFTGIILPERLITVLLVAALVLATQHLRRRCPRSS